MSSSTREQLDVLNNPARIRVVRAAPGSGKTWLVAELIRREIDTWRTECSGIAALSFTRVGGAEIHTAIGYELDYPHFVGTLDSFLFRYVVRPFLKKVYPECAPPRLIPADWSPKHWNSRPGGVELTVRIQGKNYKILEACFLGERNGEPEIGCPVPYQGIQRLDATIAKVVRDAKKKLCIRAGWLTHSDAAYLASCILVHKTHGVRVIQELARRFPLVIVDELQDTGWFLGKAIRSILGCKGIRGMLVGDPDQAIFEFNGARPDLFDCFTSLPDATELPLVTTRRCCGPVCRVAEHLSQSGRQIKEVKGRSGRAIMLHYAAFPTDVTNLRSHLAECSEDRSIKVVARKESTIESLLGKKVQTAPALGSPPLNHMHRAVNQYRLGQQTKALASARSALERATFGEEGVHDETLTDAEMEPCVWKQAAIECLFAANKEIPNETFYDWGLRTATFIKDKIGHITQSTGAMLLPVPTIRKPGKKHISTIRDGYLFKPTLGDQDDSSLTVQTVHSVKGETHDLTVLVCPPDNAKHCPSQTWWSKDPKDIEERRIAFVAMTRSAGDFILCVSSECLARLKSKHSSFVDGFECMTVAEFIEHDTVATKTPRSEGKAISTRVCK